MNVRILWLSPLLLWGCPKDLPPALQVGSQPSAASPASPPTTTAQPTTPDELLAVVVQGDPLLRRPPHGLESSTLEALSDQSAAAAALSTLQAASQQNKDVLPTLIELEAALRGTVAVPLVRGFRFSLAWPLIEDLVPGKVQADHAIILDYLTPFHTEEEDLHGGASSLETLLDSPRSSLAAEHYAERWVLEGWLDGPQVPLQQVSKALDSVQFDHLATSPAGRLIQARSTAQTQAAPPSPEQEEAAWQSLLLATELYLLQAAADTDGEQRRLREREEALAVEGHEDALHGLLQTSFDGALPQAASDRAAGGALLAIAGDRLNGTCPRQPCGGVDRGRLTQAAGRFHPDVDALAKVWRAAALKHALDALEVGHERVTYRYDAVNLCDMLFATGTRSMAHLVLRRSIPDAGVWSAYAVALGHPEVTHWEDLRALLGDHLRKVTLDAKKTAPEVFHPPLDRIVRRSLP